MSTRFFVSTLPLFDSQMVVHAYHMITQDGIKLLGSAEDYRMLGGELLAPELEYIKEIGIEPFTGNHDCFIDLRKYQLLIGMPISMDIPTKNLVCVIDNDTLLDNYAYGKLGILKRNGYRLALRGLPTAISLDTAADFFDYILLSSIDEGFSEDLKTVRPYAQQIVLVITDIPDITVFNRLAGARNVLLSGDFYCQPISKGLSEISPLKINALNLLGQINDDDFDLINAANSV
jgi:nitrogen fixation protein